jgi:hypothetical protein
MAPPPKPIDEDAQDDSSSDEDFNPDAQIADAESSDSDSDAEAAAAAQGAGKARSKKRGRDADDVDADLDSGDEATIQERKKRRRRKGKGNGKGKGGDDEDEGGEFLSDDEGGQGGFVRTRAQRRIEKVERRALASTKGATIDVDDVWSRLSSIPIGRALEPVKVDSEEDYITIKRTTRFAGQVSTEEKRVLKSSKEARIWLAEQEAAEAKKKGKRDKENEVPDATKQAETGAQDDEAAKDGHAAPKMPLRRPLKRPLRWDPNPTGEVRGLPPNLQLRYPRDKAPTLPTTAPVSLTTQANHRMPPPPLPGAAKLTTVQKSKYDWASYVDKNKLAEELDEYGRSKQSYAGRTDFLERLERRGEEARLAAVRSGR